MMAGRDISVTKMALGTVRVMGTCAVGGQAVGTAAAMAIRHGCSPRDIASRMTELQQTLIKDDCYIPGYKNEDAADLARTASVSATSEKADTPAKNVVDGVTRVVDGTDHAWESDGIAKEGETLTLQLNAAETIQEVRLVFDPNLSREIMPSMTQRVLDRQVKDMPTELVRDYVLRVWNGDSCVWEQNVRDNARRLCVHGPESAVTGDRVTLCIERTYGHPNARVYEVRVY